MASSRRIDAALRSPGPLEAAHAAWDAGEYERAVRILGDARFGENRDRVAALVLSARALLALGRPGDAAAVLRDGARDASDADDALVLQMLLGAALVRTGDLDEGDRLLDDAAGRATARRAPEIAYYRALRRWGDHRLAEAETLVDDALPGARGVVRARLLQLLGWIAVRRENYAAAAREFTAALDELDAAPEADVKGRATILHALAFIAAETIDLRLGRFVRAEYATNRWSDDTRVERFQVLEHLSWLSLLAGDLEGAWDERQRALTLTVDTSYHAIALVHAAKIAGMVGDRFSEARYLQLAGALLLRGDQLALDVERRTAMLGFVTAAREPQAETARRVMALYERSFPRRTAMLAMEGDRRIDALELYARGRIALLAGDVKHATALLQQSLDLWMHLAYRLRAALVANDLRAVTGEHRYADVAREALRDAPHAWLRAELAQPAAAQPLARLTPAQRRVLAELCKGRKAREIADDFGRSFNTINNHTRAIFGAFGVRNRAGLVSECARLGILERA